MNKKALIPITFFLLVFSLLPLNVHAQSNIYVVNIQSGVTDFTISYGNYRAYYISTSGAIKQLQIYQLAFTDNTPLDYLYIIVPSDISGNKIYFLETQSQSYPLAKIIDKSQGAYFNYNITLVFRVQLSNAGINCNFTKLKSSGSVYTNNFVSYRTSIANNKLIVTLNFSASFTVTSYTITDNVLPTATSFPTTPQSATYTVYDVSPIKQYCTGFSIQFKEYLLRSSGNIICALGHTSGGYYSRSEAFMTLTKASPSFSVTYDTRIYSSYITAMTITQVTFSYSFTAYAQRNVEFNYYTLSEAQGIQLSTSTYNIVVKKSDIAYTIQNYNGKDLYPLVLVYRGNETALSIYSNGYFYRVCAIDLLDNTKLIFADTLMSNNSIASIVHNYMLEQLSGLRVTELSRDMLLTYLYIKNGSVIPQSNSIYYNAWLQNHDKWLILQCANGGSTSAIRLSAIGYDIILVPPFREFYLNAYVYASYLLEASIQFTITDLMGYTVTYTQSSTDYYYVAVEEVSYTPTPVGTLKYRLTLTINLQSLPRDLSEKGFIFCLVLPKNIIVTENAYKDVIVTDTAYQPFPTSIEYLDNEKIILWFRYPYPLLYNAFNVYILSGSKTMDLLVSLNNVFDNVYTSGIMKNDLGLYSIPLLDKYNFILLKGVTKFGVGKLNDYLMFYNNTVYEVHGTYYARSFPVDFKGSINNFIYLDRTFTVASIYKDVSPVSSFILQNYNVEKAEYLHFDDGAIYLGRLIPYSYYVLEIHGSFIIPKSTQTQTTGRQTATFDWGTLWSLLPMLFVLIILAVVLKFVKESRGDSGGLLQKV
ncbi:MAG: hypothetical protein QXH10_10765 [Ignisphaera sp.]